MRLSAVEAYSRDQLDVRSRKTDCECLCNTAPDITMKRVLVCRLFTPFGSLLSLV